MSAEDGKLMKFSSRLLSLEGTLTFPFWKLHGLIEVLATPGFGKTALSIVAIEDLMARKSSDSFMALFHFGGDERAGYFQAYRAIVANLIHQGRRNYDMIDAAILLMDQEGSGQFQASDDDTEELLRLLLHKFPATLVFDGVDECDNIEGFLSSLFDLCKGTDTKVLLLNRPISFPATYQDGKETPWRIRLESSNNYQDIASFLNHKLTRMFDNGSISPSPFQVDVLDGVAKRSNGMFLWRS
jgi:hypothetical protein